MLAARLSEDPKNRVLLLEYGGSDRSIFIQMPTALNIPLNSDRYNWGYQSEPERNLDDRRINTPRGKALGGSSSINGLVYVRGNALDFERWEEMGARGWAYRYVLPYFRRAETFLGGADDYRGGDGPLATRSGRLANPLYRAFVTAAEQAGVWRVTRSQRLSAGGLRQPRHVRQRWRSVERVERLPSSGDEAPEPPCADRRLGRGGRV